jgi:hypothetical protein
MGYNKTQLIARRAKILPTKFIQQDMTTYSGLALVDHVLQLYRLQARLKETFRHCYFSGDYHIGDILFVLVVRLLLGGERLQHIDYLRSDPPFLSSGTINPDSPSHQDLDGLETKTVRKVMGLKIIV